MDKFAKGIARFNFFAIHDIITPREQYLGESVEKLGAVLRVVDVMSNKVVTVDSNKTVYQAVSKLLRSNVGCVVVVEKKRVVGIVTKGDVLKKTVLKGLDAKKLQVNKIMSKPVLTTTPDETIEEASKLMSKNEVSKLPVLRDDTLVGIVTSTDIIRAEPGQVRYLQELIKARYVPQDLRSSL